MMKKITTMLCVIGMLLMVMPIKVNAASFTDKDGDGIYTNDSTISAGIYGTFAAGDVTWTYATDADKQAGIKTWTFTLTTKSNVKTIYMSLVPTSLEIQSIAVGGNLTKIDESKTSSGTSVLAIANSQNGLATGTKVLLFTVKTKDTSDKGCTLNPSPLSVSCANVKGNYFDKNGNSITEAEYDKVCNGVTTPQPTTPTPLDPDVPGQSENPQTGSVIPYVAIGGGLLAIAGVYFFSRKSNKFYKI